LLLALYVWFGPSDNEGSAPIGAMMLSGAAVIHAIWGMAIVGPTSHLFVERASKRAKMIVWIIGEAATFLPLILFRSI
jgi:hypothetical protein